MYHELSRKFERLKSSHREDILDIDTNKIEKIYNEASLTFGGLIKKKLDEVIDFKNQLLFNRRKYLAQEEEKLQSSIKDTLSSLKVFEIRTSQLLSFLREKGPLEKIEKIYKELMVNKVTLERHISFSEKIQEVAKKANELKGVIKKLKEDIVNELNEIKGHIDQLCLLFKEII